MTELLSTSLAPALAHSRYLERLFLRYPALADETAAHLYQPFARSEMTLRLVKEVAQDEAQLRQQLRNLRQAVMARLIARELAGLATLAEVVHTVSDLAEVAVEHALAWATQFDERIGVPIGEESGLPQELIVVGMGKLGGHELNVSSDIDLIFIYPEDGVTDGPRHLTNHEYFAKIGKKLISLIADLDEHGFVFRVDMRLRPFGDAGPLACSFAALENYLLTQGREWERYAWIKGRALTGDADGLMQVVTPFVYRKYLDYGAYHSMRELHSQIRREVERKDRANNIKLGPGGIREIEFISQVFQLIRGGRTRSLQQRSTRAILDELGRLGLLPQETIIELQQAYEFLRNLEHRLMYLDDAQTQTLPTADNDQLRIAISMGHSDWPSFLDELEKQRGRVTRHFEQVFVLPPDQDENHPQAALWQQIQQQQESPDNETSHDDLARLGYKEPAEIQRRLAVFASGSAYQQMPDRCRKRVDAILPPLIEVAAGFPNPDATLLRILDLLAAIGRRESYLALLAEHPQTLKRLASLYSASPWVSEYLTQHPILLDELLDVRLLYQNPDWKKLGLILHQELMDLGDDIEAKMDCLRHFQHTQVFRLVSQDLAGLLPLETLSDHLSDLADLILAVTLEQAWQELPGRHRTTPKFAIIGYGKLGGKELGYASDLDLVYLYDDDHPNAGELYAKLAKKIVNWLSTLTAAGLLYEIDLRLRPNGAAGLLVSNLEAFGAYQLESAWVWEHQAITRARYVAGDRQIGVAFEAIREKILCQRRNPTDLGKAVIEMRHKMLENHPAKNSDIKHCRGGIIDIEFIVQYLILAHANLHPRLTANLGNITLLGLAAEDGLLDTTLVACVQRAYRELRRLQHASRLNGNTLATQTFAPLADDMAAVRSLWKQLFNEEVGQN